MLGLLYWLYVNLDQWDRGSAWSGGDLPEICTHRSVVFSTLRVHCRGCLIDQIETWPIADRTGRISPEEAWRHVYGQSSAIAEQNCTSGCAARSTCSARTNDVWAILHSICPRSGLSCVTAVAS